jgi:ssDNA-binding Zn-finger/Zn-ribbon topoisomerase 1
MVEGYCVKCKKKREMKNAKEVTMKNKKKAVKGECPECGTKMFKIGGKL